MRQPDYKMVQGGNIMQNMSPQVAGSVGQGLARLGKTLTDVGVEANEVVERLHHAENDRLMLEQQQKWEGEYAEHEKDMLDNRNSPLKWQTMWDTRAKKLTDDMEKSDVARDLRGRMSQTFMRWNGGVNRDIGQRAHQTAYRNTASMYEVRYNELKRRGDTEGMRAVAGEAVSKNYWNDAQGKEAEYDADYTELELDIMGDVDVDPLGELEKMKEKSGKYANPALAESDLNRHMKNAEIVAKRRESQAIEDISSLPIKNERDLIHVVESNKYISGKTGKSLVESYRSNKPATPRQLVDWKSRINDLKLDRQDMGSAKYNEKYNRIKLEIYAIRNTDVDLGVMKTMLKGISPYTDHSSGVLPAKQKNRQQTWMEHASTRIARMKRAGDFGTWHEKPADKKDAITGTPNNPDMLPQRDEDNLKVKTAVSDLETSIEDMIKRYPDMTSTKFEEELNKLIKEAKDKADVEKGLYLIQQGKGERTK